MVRFGSVCSGIEAASVAWQPLGWEAAWFSEIEPFPCAVLAHHYPTVPNLGNMVTLPGRILAGEVEAPDLLCGGTPCQAFSVAGLRRSLDDARGNLSLTFCELADAIDTVRSARGDDPAIIVWENVPGITTTKDNAFGCFLGQLAGEDEAIEVGRWPRAGLVDGRRRRVAWVTLDAQFFGVAQRRRRVFVLAVAQETVRRFGERADPATLLLIGSCLQRDTPSRREAQQGVAGGVTDGIVGSLCADSHPGDGQDAYTGRLTPHAFDARQSDMGDAAPCVAIQDVRDVQKCQNGRGWNTEGTAYTVDTHATQGVATAMQVRRLTPRECERLQGFPDDYTAIPWRGRPANDCPDGPRYKALGNSWAVPVVRWIGSRINEVLK